MLRRHRRHRRHQDLLLHRFLHTAPPSSTTTADTDHLLSTVKSKSDLLASYTVTPPIHPWPQPLLPKRLALILRRQTDIDLSLRIFHHASNFVPGFRHNYLTYHTLIHKLAAARSFHHLDSILSHLASSSPPIRCGEEAFITVIRAYGLAGKPSASLRTFLSIRPRFGVNTSVRSFNTLLNAMIQNRRFDLVAVLFKNCQNKFGIVPNVFTCNILIKAFCKLDNLDSAKKVLEEMPLWGMVPNLVTYTTIIAGYCARGDMDGAMNLFEEMTDRGFKPDATSYTVLIDGFCLLGQHADAARIMDDMEASNVAPNDITYSVMIESCCKEKKSGEALNLLQDMLDGNYMPVSALCCKVIDVLCEDGKVDGACRLWRKMLHKNCMPDNSILSALVHWLCKEGKVRDAMSLFQEFERAFIPSVLTYNTLISGMCENGALQEAAKLWDNMLEKQCFPNAFTYNMLIKGFCKAGKVEEGVSILEEMLRKGCAPNKMTYTALIDGLCQSGAREKVSEIIRLGASGVGGFLLDEECWDVFVRKFVTRTQLYGASIDHMLHT